MEADLVIVVPGHVTSWQQETKHRRTRAGKHYSAPGDIPAAAAYREHLKQHIWLAAREAHWEIPVGPVEVRILAFRQPPQSRPKVRALTLREAYPCGRPDCTNALKIAEDAATEILWKDDSYNCDVRSAKFYCEPGEPERLEIHVRVITESPAERLRELRA